MQARASGNEMDADGNADRQGAALLAGRRFWSVRLPDPAELPLVYNLYKSR